ncbi:flagellar hook-associated protein 2 [Lachnospiraceae bacterium XBB2008]|nr:flagellar hook-associated protein 2 [Lachnospiraceae bacterium XBB2008]
MPMRMSGLISGLDTDSLISQLVSAKRLKVTKAKGDQTKLSWKQEKWKDLNKQLVNLRSMASNLRWSNAWNKKATSVSDSTKANVITSENAVDSVQSLKITQLAKSAYLTGGQINLDADGKPTGEKYTALTKLSDLGLEGSASISITTNGKTSSISLNGDSSISNVLSALKKEGLNASFDENNQRFFISAKSTGTANDFSITANDASGQNLLDKLGISTYDETAVNNLRAQVDYSSSDVAAEALKRAQNAAENYKTLYNSKIAAQKKVEDAQRAYDDGMANDTLTSEDKDKLREALDAANAALTDASAKADAARSGWTVGDEASDIVYNEDGTIKSIDNVSATDDVVNTVEQEFENRKAFAQSQLDAIASGTLKGTAANKIQAQDAKINLNGVDFSNSTNVFDINGLTITALAETSGDETVTLTTSNDTSGIYDQVKNFIKTYNTIINELDKLYNADSASKYTPLTDEEKDALSETEVEKYEQKIKDGLFKSDESLNTIMSSLTQSMSQAYTVGDKTLYLSNFGINTLSYFEAEKNESHAFHIDGDPDDEKTSGKTDMLKSLIASDPDQVSSFFSKLSNELYSKLDSLSTRIAGRRSYGSFFEDQTMKSDYTSYDSKVSDLEQAANDYEDRLYTKFSKMEAAMAKLQSKTSALSGLFGGNM